MKNKLFIFMILSLMLVSLSAVCAEDTASLNLNETDTATTNSVLCQNNEVELVENTLSENDMDFNNLNMSNAKEITNEPNVGDKIYVNPINGDDNNTGVDWNNSVKTINKALTLVNDNGLIYLAEGEHTTPATINKNVTLIGQNQEKTILTNSNNCFLTITSNNVGIYNITFKNNQRAILINGKNGKYYINNCSFINNTATSGYGGAIYMVGGNITIINSLFINNTAQYGCGGAICISNGNLTITNSTFINNAAQYGGAIYIGGGNLIVSNSTFINNTATDDRGAIHIVGGNLTITNSTFINNTAQYGGAIYIGGGNLTITNSTFINNTVTSDGGAICSDNGNFIVSNSIFINNTATGNYGNGGAICIGGGNLIVSNSTFINNTAQYGCGGVIYMVGGNFTISNSAFMNNTATNGGAIDMADGNLIVSNSTFINNTATNGGAISMDGNFTVSNSVFVNNIAIGDYNVGGAIYMAGGNFTVSNSTFINNAAQYYGGVIYMVGGNFTVSNSVFVNNTANYDGGVIYMAGGNFTVSNSVFVNNTVNYEGGAISINRVNFTVSNSTFINNTVTGDYRTGGAIYMAGGNFTISNSTFTNNAARYGKSIYMASGNLTISNSAFINSTATEGFWVGGAIDMAGGNLIVSNSTFINNTAQYGGVIDVSGGNLIVSNSTFINNTAQYGGVIKVSGGNLIIVSNSTFINNTAELGGVIYRGLARNIDVDGNWWGSNNPDWSSLFDGHFTPNSFVVLDVSVNEISFNVYNVIANLYLNGTQTIADIPTRNITFKCGSEVITGKMVNGTYNKTYTLDEGDEKNVTVSVDNEIQNIHLIGKKITPVMTVNLSDIVYGEDGIITVILPDDINGKLTIYVDNVSNEVDIINGSAQLTVPGLNAGTHNISAEYAGNQKYTPVNSTATLNVAKATPNLNVVINDIKYGEIFEITATLTGVNNTKLTGNITVTVNNKQYNITVINGEGTLTGVELPIGNYKFNATWDGDNNYNSTAYSGSFNVDKAIPDLNVVIDDVIYGEIFRITATLTGVNNTKLTGNVTVTVNNKQYIVEVVDGEGFLTGINLPAGSYKFTAIWEGDDNYNSAACSGSFNVAKLNATMDVIIPKDIKAGDDIIIMVNVPEDATGDVSVEIDGKTYTASIIKGSANITVPPLTEGYYNVTVTYNGDEKYNSVTKTETLNVINTRNVNLNVTDIVMIYHDGTRLIVILTDYMGNPIANAKIYFTINGVTYNRTTDATGGASMALNLNPGIYNASILFNGSDIYNKASKNTTATIKSTIDANSIVKFYQNDKQFFATFIDTHGNILANTDVTFNINGVFYTRKTNENGTARLAINLRPGEYILTALNPNSTEQKGFSITVKSLIEADDLTKYFQNASKFEAKIYNKDGTLATNTDVTFNINGVFYTRTTNDEGIVSLAINLRPGTYTITTIYDGLSMGNTVKVLPTLETNDLSMKYKDGSKFQAKTVDGQGNLLANQTVTFNVNGVFYHKVTGDDGVASLNINLNPGEYIITSIWNNYQVGNKITIA